MKYIAIRHDLTAFEPSKKARSPPGRIAATRLEPVFTRRKERGKIEIWKKKDGSRTLAT